MLVSFDIKLIRQNQKQCRNSEACRASPTLFLVEPDKLDVSRNCHGFLFIVHDQKIQRHKEGKKMKTKLSFIGSC